MSWLFWEKFWKKRGMKLIVTAKSLQIRTLISHIHLPIYVNIYILLGYTVIYLGHKLFGEYLNEMEYI